MCTLILGVDVVAPGTLIAGANRDEDPARPSDPPAVLSASPFVVGGRDRRSGGTWLALREGRALVAMLNRRPSGPPPDAPRSRGLLALDTACVPAPPGADTVALSRIAREAALAALARDSYAAFSMVFGSAVETWMIAHEPPRPPTVTPIGPGWHVLTHTELDDEDEPRAARLLQELAGWRPRSTDEALDGVAARLREHGSATAAAPGARRGDADAVCIHRGRMVTVSSSRIALDGRGARFWHVEGRPCENAGQDLSALAAGTSRSGGTP